MLRFVRLGAARDPQRAGCWRAGVGANLLPTSISNWVEQIRGGDLHALSRAITAVENRAPESQALLRELFHYSGRARILGITGSPGAGKSTLADALARHYRHRSQSVAILAIDPTSPFSGGAILGDRIRMQSHAGDDGTFIRSMATRGALGGLASATADVAMLLDAGGRERVLIETVGAGQDEVDIVRLADVTLVVLVPGMGDDVQSIKAGIMEIADIFVVNKAERNGAGRLERELYAMQSLAARRDGWTPPVVRTTATEGTGIAESLPPASWGASVAWRTGRRGSAKCCARRCCGASSNGHSPKTLWPTTPSRSPPASATRIRLSMRSQAISRRSLRPRTHPRADPRNRYLDSAGEHCAA